MDNHSFTAPFTLGGIPLTMYRAKHLAKQGRRPLCVLLALVVLATVFTTLRLPAQAAGAPIASPDYSISNDIFLMVIIPK